MNSTRTRVCATVECLNELGAKAALVPGADAQDRVSELPRQ